MIYDFMKNDPFEDYLVNSLSTKELKCEKIASRLDLVETIFNIEESEEGIVF